MLKLLASGGTRPFGFEEIKEVKNELTRSSVSTLLRKPEIPSHKRSRSPSLLSALFRPCLDLYTDAEAQFRDKVAACDLLVTWLTKACRACSEEQQAVQDLKKTVLERDLHGLFDSMLTDWDLGAQIHTPLREVFSKCLTLQKFLVPTYAADQKALLTAALGMDQSQKSLYYAIEILRKALGTTMILECEPAFFKLRLPNMQETSTATPLARLLSGVMLQKLPVKASGEQQVAWLREWQGDVMRGLLTKDSGLSQNLLTYLMPSLFKASETAFEIFMRDLIEQDATLVDPQVLHLIIDCLRKAKDVQIIGDVDDALLERLQLPRHLLRAVMTHEDAAMRVSAIDLLVAHPKPSVMFSPSIYETLQDTISSLFYETDMQYRKQILDGLRAFFMRFQASLYSCASLTKKAQMKNDLDQQQYIDTYLEKSKTFAMWLKQLLKSNLEPGSGYQVTYITLQMLHLAANFGWHGGPSSNSPKFSAFRATKGSAVVKELPFPTDLFDHEMIRLLLDRLGDSFDDNRALALALLTTLPAPLPGLDSSNELSLVFSNAQRLVQSTRGRDGDGGARVMQFLFERFLILENRRASIFVPESSNQCPPVMEFMYSFMHSIEVDCEDFQSKPLAVAESRPLHGRLTALRYMIESIDYASQVKNTSLDSWRTLHSRLRKTCDKVWISVKDVLCDDSPEGNLPESAEISAGDALRGQDTQVILSFCWRALREASELLRAVLARVPFNHDCALLVEEDFIAAGQLSLAWLTEVRHRGAFSAVYPNFVEIARRLQQMHDHPKLQSLPAQWMAQSVEDLSQPFHSKDITRRSGGLPMSIISIMLSEAESGHGRRVLIDTAIKRLIGLVMSPVGSVDDKTELPQVHGYNTLKDIFLESKLSPFSIDYVEQCFVMSIDGFSSPIWAIRNCALMLFSALVRRSFGSRNSRLEATTNTFSAAAFFHRYPKVLTRLTTELTDAKDELLSSDAAIATGLNPCLTLLARLDRTEATEDEEEVKFEGLTRLLTTIAASPNWHVRSMAAQALPTFIEEELIGSFIVQQLNGATTKDQNALHGRLLMIDHLLRYHLNRRDTTVIFVEQVLGDFRRAILGKFVELTSENPCSTTEALWLRILLFLAKASNPKLNAPLRQRVVDYCAREIAKPKISSTNVIGAAKRIEMMTIILLRALADPNFKRFQNSSVSTALTHLIEDARLEVRLTTYSLLVKTFSDSVALKSEAFQTALQRQSLRETWPVAKIAARSCLSQLPPLESRNDELSTKLLSMYFDDLQRTKEGNPSTDVTLELLGKLIPMGNKQDILNYRAILVRFTRDDQSADTRKACLQSLKHSKLIDGTNDTDSELSAETTISFLSVLLDLLTDDDEEIRQAAASFTCSVVMKSTPTTPERTRVELIKSCATMTSPELQSILLTEITRGEVPHAALKKATQPSNLLFAVEKQNLWRNDVSHCQQALAGLSCMPITHTTMTHLSDWCFDALRAIADEIQVHEYDGPLGWTSIGDVWHIIRRTLLITNWLTGSEVTTSEIKESLRASLRVLRELSAAKHMHPSFLRSIGMAI